MMNGRKVTIVSREVLSNGLIRCVSDSGLVGLYNADGTARSGDLASIIRRVAPASR